jgi:hypothetical protein
VYQQALSNTCSCTQFEIDVGLPGLVAAHALGNSAAWLHAQLHIRNVSWVNRTALVVHTPFGMALPALWQPLVGPIVPAYPIQSFAE